ncbi:VOC family protein [Granulicella sp. S190]|uniref:VOC family protein n=1 Tax=Granulicella sp. S190 TaxID=1747226 RepID=UPI00131D2B1D|nr:VOC family protein [Granulicella sp. S190]
MLVLTLSALLLNGVTAQGRENPQRPSLASVSHLSVYSSDLKKTEQFYVHDLGATKGTDPQDSAGVRYYFSPVQFVEVLPLPADDQDQKNRFRGVGYNVANAEEMRRYLDTHSIVVPAAVTKGSDGSEFFAVNDPEGNRIEFVQPPPHPIAIQPSPISQHIMHVGYIVHDVAAENDFYLTLLGFRPYWHGGMKDDSADWISMQLPDGRDWVEFMTAQGPEKTGIPTAMSQETAGVLDHFALGVDNIEHSYNLLFERDGLNGRHSPVQLGRDGKWQLNLYDPDGTRAELMEFHPAEKPCCSPFLLPSPTR